MTPLSNVEREVKLDVGLRFELPDFAGVLPGVVATRLPDAKLQAAYVDTADLRLMRWGVTLRHRHDAVGGATGESGWTVKLPGNPDGVSLVRTEYSWPGKANRMPPEVASLVRAQARSASLGLVARLNTQRRKIELRDPAGVKLAEVDDDVVSVMDGRRLAARFRQVEVEMADAASEELIVAVLHLLAQAGAVAGDDRPKVVRALGPRASLGPDVVVPELGPKSTVSTVVAAAIAAGVTRIIKHDPGVRLDDDPEHVHQARVGTRRLRSDLQTFRRLLDPDWAGPIRAELGWLAAALGEVRDADVLTGRLRAQIRDLPDIDARPAAALLRRLAVERDEARGALLQALESDRYVLLLEDLTRAAADPPLALPMPAATSARLDERVVEPDLAPVDDLLPPPTHAGPAESPRLVITVADRSPLEATQAEVESGPGGNGSGRAAASAEGPAPPRLTAVLTSVGDIGPAGGRTGETGTPTPATTSPSHFPILRSIDAVPLGERIAAEVLPTLVRRPWKHLQEAVDALGDDPPDEALHEVRIRAKRLRYAAEAVSGVIGRPARRLASAVAEVQGVLGDMQDAVVAETWLRRRFSSGSAAQALVAGQLVTLERQKQAESRTAWKRPWKAASAKDLRSWLKT